MVPAQARFHRQVLPAQTVIADQLAHELTDPVHRPDQADQNITSHILFKVPALGQLALHSGRPDLQAVALFDRVGGVEQIADRAGKRLAGIEVDPIGVLVDVVAQIPSRALLLKHHIPEIDSHLFRHRCGERLADCCGVLFFSFRLGQPNPPIHKRKSEAFPTLSRHCLFLLLAILPQVCI